MKPKRITIHTYEEIYLPLKAKLALKGSNVSKWFKEKSLEEIKDEHTD